MQLKRESTKAIGLWILHNITYRWGCLLWIVIDNNPTFLAALQWLEKYYGIKHIRISRYNSHANGIVEHAHYDVREAVFKACNRDKDWWFAHIYSVPWAECVTIWKCMGLFTIFWCPWTTSATSAWYCRIKQSLASTSKFAYIHGTHNPLTHFTTKASSTIGKVMHKYRLQSALKRSIHTWFMTLISHLVI